MRCVRVRDLILLIFAAVVFQAAHAEIEYFYSGATGGVSAYANKLISYDTVSGSFSVVGPLSDQSLQPNFTFTGQFFHDLSNNTITFQACMVAGAWCNAPASYTTITIDAATGHTISTVPMSGAASLLPSGTFCCFPTIPTVSAATLNSIQTSIGQNSTDIVDLQATVSAHSSDIASLQGVVATNIANIASNTASIATNTADISTNSASIAAINKYHQVNSTGVAANAAGANGVAIGDGTNAAGANAIAVGHNASAGNSNSMAIGANSSATADNATALGANSVADESNTVSVGSATNARRITNVATGVHSSDAVNVGQLQAGLNQVLSQANAYTDQQVSGLRNYVNRRANGGTAAAMALSGIPQPVGDGKIMIGIGYGNWRGSQGMAIGGAAVVGTRTVIKAAATLDDQGGKGFAGGIGLQF